MIEACIFDIGGTLVRTEEALLEVIKETLLENNLTPPPDEEISIHFGIGHKNIFVKVISKIHKQKNAASLIERCYNSFEKKYPSKFLDKFQIIPGAESCLNKLNERGIRTVCQTGMERSEALILLKRFNILKYFPILVTFEDAEKPRPNPEAMYLTMKKLNITNKSKCLYVGDTVSDIRFARNAGVKIASVITGPQKRETLEKEKPDYIIDNISEVLDIVDAPAGI